MHRATMHAPWGNAMKRSLWLLCSLILITPAWALEGEEEIRLTPPPSPQQPKAEASPPQDNNSCIEGTLAGGLVGAGIGAVVTQGRARWLGIPVGAVGGALLGCQIDGG